MSELAENREFDFSRFSNTYEHTLDAKNRLFIPAKVRETVGTSFYLFHPLREKCLYIYSSERWEEVARQIISKNDRNYERVMFGNVVPVETDKQGRITIRADFCKKIGLKKSVTIAGTGKRLEIWDTDTRNAELERQSEMIEMYSDVEF